MKKGQKSPNFEGMHICISSYFDAIFLTHLAKGNVSFYHHLASVIR